MNRIFQRQKVAADELGYKISADKNDSLNLNLNATGFAGRQKGVIFQLQLSKSF